MSKVNADVQVKLKWLKDEWVAGVNAGVESPANPLPGFFNKPYKNMTARERGFVFGYSLTYEAYLHEALAES